MAETGTEVSYLILLGSMDQQYTSESSLWYVKSLSHALMHLSHT